jgi:hypothetical protein
MVLLAKFVVLLLSSFGAISVISYFFGISIVFPFTITDDLYVPEHRLHTIRLATFTTFVYFGFRYLFFGTTKLQPIQFLGVFLFNLGTVGGLCFYVNNVDLTEYYQVPFYIISSIILYNAGKPKFRSYFKK